jgi:hypothetical protein
VSLWNPILLFAVGFCELGLCIPLLIIDVMQHFVEGSHILRPAFAACLLLGISAAFMIVSSYVRLGKAIHQLSQQLKPRQTV